MRNYIKSPENRLVENIETGKEVSGKIFPISVQLKPKWLANFLHKQKGSDIIPHLAYFNFRSNRDQMVTGYSNSPHLNTNYGTLIYTEDMQTPYVGKLHEFESSDYRKIGCKPLDWVSIVYQNRSEVKEIPFPFGVSLEFTFNAVYSLRKKYPTYYAYAFVDSSTYNNYDTWYMINSKPLLFQNDPTDLSLGYLNEQCILTDGVATITPYDWVDSTASNLIKVVGDFNLSVFDALPFIPIRNVSIKVDESSFRHYVTKSEEYTYISAKDPAEPLIFFNQLYNSEWNRYTCIDLINTYGESGDILNFQEAFFPELNDRGMRYPKTARFTRNEETPSLTFQDGTLFKSPLRHQNERDDQSIIRYEVSKGLLQGSILNSDWHIEKYWDDDFIQPLIINGIDIKGESNRRVSTTCLTEPYQVAEPMNSGEFCQFKWVDWEGKNNSSLSDGLYAKFRVSIPLFNEIIGMYNLSTFNTDVIHTITFKEIPFAALPASAIDPYQDFTGSYPGSSYSSRRNFDIVDLVGGQVGVGGYYEFYINTTDPLYSDGKMKVLGVSQSEYLAPVMGGGVELESYYIIYVGNFSPENAPLHNNPNPPVVTSVEFLDLSTFIIDDEYTIDRFETLAPMMRLHAMQGNIKIRSILEESVKIVKTSTYIEFHAEIETPYCVGMNDIRMRASSFIDDEEEKELWNITQLIKQKSYIPAGSQEIVDGKKEEYNRRFIPLGDDLMTPYKIAANRPHPTDRLIDTLTGKQYIYPPYSVWWSIDNAWPNVSRPIETEFSDHGTFDVRVAGFVNEGSGDFAEHPTFDIRLLVYANNQKWKFGEKYLSYIERENPQYIYKMSIKTLLEDYTKYQTNNYGIPDNKQYVASLVRGNVEADQNDGSEPLFGLGGGDFRDIIGEMKTDMKLEFWDFTLKKWQPFSQTSFSSSKKIRTEELSNLFIVESTAFSSNNPESLITTPKPFWKVTLGYFDDQTQLIQMPPEAFELDGETNFALYNKDQDKVYHVTNISAIVYTEFGPGPDNNALEIIVEDDVAGDLIVIGESAVDPSNLPSNYIAPLTLNTPDQIKAGVSKYEFNSQVSKPHEFKTVALSTQLNPDAFDIDNETFYLRFSADADAEYRIGDKEIQYIGTGLDTEITPLEKEYSNFPWGDGTTFDAVFDFSKINAKEVITRINAHYINLNNVY